MPALPHKGETLQSAREDLWVNKCKVFWRLQAVHDGITHQADVVSASSMVIDSGGSMSMYPVSSFAPSAWAYSCPSGDS
eukprot:m.30015 g.30015  ORF g.30015 m.30015 type:complete len:79 (-) comp12178_c0_seq1:7318-7554(-)